MISDRLEFSSTILRHFINGCFGLNRQTHKITGFELMTPLVESAAYNTYVETMSDKADTLYLRCKNSLCDMMIYSYLDYIDRLSNKFDWKNKEFILAFDYTDENFYGDVQGFNIHGWTGKDGVTGKFKFLTCSIVSDEIPEKIPLITVPIHVGHYKSQTIIYCLNLIKKFIGKINLVLFDRGFYDKDLMYSLSQNDFPYLIFLPKSKNKKELLAPLAKDEKIAIHTKFKLNKNKTSYVQEHILIFLKQIYDPKSEKEYDWVFATNLENMDLEKIVQTYKKRWRIETGFRVQDEAKIKCKSKDMNIRYFLFLFEQILQTQWVCFYKKEVTFKKFLIEMQKTCKKLAENPNKKYGKV
jgi:hypothetical protein